MFRRCFSSLSDPASASFSPLSSTRSKLKSSVQAKRPYERLLVLRRATRLSSAGKQMKYDAWAVAGDQNGTAGFASGRSAQANRAIQIALRKARQRAQTFPLFEQRTLFHDITASFRSTRIAVFPRHDGYSLRAPHVVADVFRAIGVRDVGARILSGSSNPVTAVQAIFHSLSKQHKTPEAVAQCRGISVSELNKRYTGWNKK